ncbi:hypothetical protein DICPUDRAFT_160011 [Dictyostelium purpureum]|uniref:SAM domain-containing protein n=1 Tax=Dictyostelium purpureum TaxID=5786 RepID=F1A5H5_DICPU|nr:uncharacterized protein DICPUDRAFT_160011 [Dictyostelium purpureum]EGC28555.1 hypothetical protein DICPUDRAFT_160011 [Dictyostelium purpureum]|eukprot:XP_003294917.1 hypothetical protein DICPUDRAFT_160011 [Dictyostelium purpureum]
MGISINNRLSFFVEYKKLKSNEETIKKNDDTQNSDYDANKSRGPNNISKIFDSSKSPKFGIVYQWIIGSKKSFEEEKKNIKSFKIKDTILKNNVLNQLKEKWKNQKINISLLIFAYEFKEFSLLGLDTLGKRLNFQYEMSILLRKLDPSLMVSFLLVDPNFLEKNVEQVNDALLKFSLEDKPSNYSYYNDLSEIFKRHNINGVALLSLMEEDLIESLGIVDDNLKTSFFTFYHSIFKS